MNDTFKYISVTNKNLDSKDAVFDATVVANYGDPGLDEDYHADILSRYVICMIESSNRAITKDRYKNMLVVVARPESLWINYQGGWGFDASSQSRVDFDLNSNTGPAASYSINSIPRINSPYFLGEKLKIKLIKSDTYYYSLNSAPFFMSGCDYWQDNDASVAYYQNWHNQGLNSNPYLVNSNGINNIQKKTITPAGGGLYNFCLNKIQYESFALSMFPQQSKSLVSLFSNASSFTYYYAAYGGYAFSTMMSVNFNFVKYEDMNVNNKARIANTNCLPLIVTSPTTFTVPKSRNSGTVNYNPTYLVKG